jgi:hypothetical protein
MINVLQNSRLIHRILEFYPLARGAGMRPRPANEA